MVKMFEEKQREVLKSEEISSIKSKLESLKQNTPKFDSSSIDTSMLDRTNLESVLS